MVRARPTKYKGVTIQHSVYLPETIYWFLNEKFKEDGYGSISDYMRGIIRDFYLKRRCADSIAEVESIES